MERKEQETLKEQETSKEQETLKELVKAYQSGTPDAYEEIYRLTHKKLMKKLSRIVRNRTDAEDILQDTYLAIYKKLSGMKQPESFEPWSSKIAVNKGLSYLRKEKPAMVREVPYPEPGTKEESYLSEKNKHLITAEMKSVLNQNLARLEPEERAVLVLLAYEQVTPPEIARIMEMPEQDVKDRIASARLKLKDTVLQTSLFN